MIRQNATAKRETRQRSPETRRGPKTRQRNTLSSRERTVTRT
jgi:hypothetical protein